MRSVLRGAHQDRDVLPDRCVLTGRRTDGAIRVRATSRRVPEVVADVLGPAARTGRRVALPIDGDELRWYRRRQALVAMPTGIGITFTALGAVPFGLALVVLGIAGSWWTRRRHWFQVRMADDGRDVVVLRGHALFDQDARRLFTATIK